MRVYISIPYVFVDLYTYTSFCKRIFLSTQQENDHEFSCPESDDPAHQSDLQIFAKQIQGSDMVVRKYQHENRRKNYRTFFAPTTRFVHTNGPTTNRVSMSTWIWHWTMQKNLILRNSQGKNLVEFCWKVITLRWWWTRTEGEIKYI